MEIEPNEGDRVTGRFDNVSLVNATTMAPDGALTGTFAATIAVSDGSANCAAPPPMMMGMDPPPGGGFSPGPMCDNDACDGPCCPLLPDFNSCLMGCVNILPEPGMLPDPNAFFGCITDCEQVLIDDPNCGPPFQALYQCRETNMCMGQLGEDPCLAANCCDEFKAAF